MISGAAGAERRSRRWLGKAGAALGALLLSAAGLVGAAAPTYAEDGSVNTAVITSVEFTNPTFSDGSVQELTVGWQADASDGRGVEIRIQLPSELYGQSDRFSLSGEAGTVAGSCLVTSTDILCELDDSYLNNHRGPVSGSLTFRVLVTVNAVEMQTRTFKFGDIETPAVTVNPKSGPCTENCEYTGQEGGKSGRYNTVDDTIEWAVYMPATAQGMMPLGARVTVTDNMDLSQFEIIGDPIIHRAGSVYIPSTGGSGEWPNYSTSLTSDQYTLSADKRSVTFIAEPGRAADPDLPNGLRGLEGSVYLVIWKVKVLDLGALETYTNSVHWEIDGVVSEEITSTVTHTGGSGNVVGQNRGKFAVTKVLADGVAAPQGTEFTLRWKQFDLDDPSAEARQGATQLQIGDTFFSAEITPNTRVVIEEVLPSDPAGFEWGAPKFIETDASGTPLPNAAATETLTLDFLDSPRERLGQVSYFTLTNTLSALPEEPGSFSISKMIKGDAASLVPADTEFEVAYSWPSSDAYAAGSGSIMVPSSGDAVTVEGIPAGAVVTLAEGQLPAIEGAVWGAPEFSHESFEIRAGLREEVTLTNTLEPVTPPVDPVDPVDPVTPVDPAKPPVKPVTPSTPAVQAHQLASTGNAMSPWGLTVPLALVLAGGALVLLRRSRSTHKDATVSAEA